MDRQGLKVSAIQKKGDFVDIPSHVASNMCIGDGGREKWEAATRPATQPFRRLIQARCHRTCRSSHFLTCETSHVTPHSLCHVACTSHSTLGMSGAARSTPAVAKKPNRTSHLSHSHLTSHTSHLTPRISRLSYDISHLPAHLIIRHISHLASPIS